LLFARSAFSNARIALGSGRYRLGAPGISRSWGGREARNRNGRTVTLSGVQIIGGLGASRVRIRSMASLPS
jgi:hypothetical protein